MRIDELDARYHYLANCEKGPAWKMFCGHAAQSPMELLINLAIHIQIQSLHRLKPGKEELYIYQINKTIPIHKQKYKVMPS